MNKRVSKFEKPKTIKMVRAFLHSYSREFGFPVTDTEPERYCIVYHLQVGSECYNTIPLKIEYHSSNDKYFVFSRSEQMDKVMANRPFVFSTRDEAKKAAISYYEEYKIMSLK